MHWMISTTPKVTWNLNDFLSSVLEGLEGALVELEHMLVFLHGFSNLENPLDNLKYG